LSFRERDNYIDPEYSGVAQAIRERNKIPIALFPSPVKSLPPSCPICHRHYIAQENGTILFCPGCGAKIKANEIKQETKVSALYPPLSQQSSKILISQREQQRQRKAKSPEQDQADQFGELTQEELTKELGFEPTQTIT